LSRNVLALALLCLAAHTHAQTAPPALPTEIDTLQVGRTVVIANIRGDIFRKAEGGALLPVKSGESVEPGNVLLVRKGASFSIGRTTIGPESHGDRWVQLE
jgi:hypothetical protein